MEDETTRTFVWLFTEFSRCMFDVPPSAVITDQDAAICRAVGKVFPERRHQYCMWHLRKHELEHLQGYRSRFANFDQVYQRWVRSGTLVVFEAEWPNICQEFSADSKSWLFKMYEKRAHWIKCYLHYVFWAGMSTKIWHRGQH